MQYEVNVGNIGSVYKGNDKDEAQKHFDEYVEQSKTERGRAGSESVWMMEEDEIIQEFIGSIDDGSYGEVKQPLRLQDCKCYDVVVIKVLSTLKDLPVIVWKMGENECVVVAVSPIGNSTSAGTVALPLETIVEKVWEL